MRSGRNGLENVDEVLGNYAAATQHIRDLQQYAQWASGFQVLLMVADDALFFVRRSVTILAFDPIYIMAAIAGFVGARKLKPLLLLTHITLNFAVTFIVSAYVLLLALFGTESAEDVRIIFALHLPLLIEIGCAIPSILLLRAISKFQYPQEYEMPSVPLGSNLLQLAGPNTGGVLALAGAAALARARSQAGLHHTDSDEIPDVPTHFLDPILGTIMADPCVTQAGNTYERATIERWLEHHNTDPLTNTVMADLALIPNNSLKSEISTFTDNLNTP